MRLRFLFSILGVASLVYFTANKDKEGSSDSFRSVAVDLSSGGSIDAGSIQREETKDQDGWDDSSKRNVFHVKDILIEGAISVSPEEIKKIVYEMGNTLSYTQLDILELKIKKLYESKGLDVVVVIDEDALNSGSLVISLTEFN